MINKPPPFKGLHIKILIIIPIKGTGPMFPKSGVIVDLIEKVVCHPWDHQPRKPPKDAQGIAIRCVSPRLFLPVVCSTDDDCSCGGVNVRLPVITTTHNYRSSLAVSVWASILLYGRQQKSGPEF